MLRAEKGRDEKVLVATCTSANGKPPGVLSWETRLKGEAEYQEVRNPNGTVTVVSRYRLVPGREAHLQPLACIVNYHLDRFRESITVHVQCERAGRPPSQACHPPAPFLPSRLHPPLSPLPLPPPFLLLGWFVPLLSSPWPPSLTFLSSSLPPRAGPVSLSMPPLRCLGPGLTSAPLTSSFGHRRA